MPVLGAQKAIPPAAVAPLSFSVFKKENKIQKTPAKDPQKLSPPHSSIFSEESAIFF